MSDERDDDLSVDARAALRDVPPADPAVRDAHIAAALDAIGDRGAASGATRPSGRRASGGRTWLVAAAAVVLVGGGVLAGRASRVDAPDLRNSASATTVPPKAQALCADQLAGRTYVGEFTDADGAKRFLSLDEANLYVHDATSCEIVETIPRP